MRKYFFTILLGVLSLTGVCLLLLSTSKWGVNLNFDSIFYLIMARFFGNYHVNKDVVGILCLHPPLFPLVLSWWYFIGIDPHEGARWVNSILFGLNIVLIGIVTKKYTRSAWLGLYAALLMLSAPDILGIHLTAQSEPLFIFFMLIWLLLFLDYFKNSKLSTLILGSIIVALASMARYLGAPIIAAGVFVILFLKQERNFINKLVRAVLFASIPCLSLFFYARYSYVESSPFQIHFVFHPVNVSYFQAMASNFCAWFISSHLPVSANARIFLFTTGIVFCFIRLFFWCRANKIPGADSTKTIFIKFSILGIAFISLYMACIIISASFYDTTQMNDPSGADLRRYLIPLHITGIIIFCGFMSNFFQERSSSFKKDIGRIIVAYFFLFYIIGSINCLMDQYFKGDKYISNPYRFSYIIRKVKTTPTEAPIYSNNFRAVYIWGGKISYFIPIPLNPFSLEKNDKYLYQLSQMMADLRKKKGILVYFNKDASLGRATESIQDLQDKIPLHLIARDGYASIFDVK